MSPARPGVPGRRAASRTAFGRASAAADAAPPSRGIGTPSPRRASLRTRTRLVRTALGALLLLGCAAASGPDAPTPDGAPRDWSHIGDGAFRLTVPAGWQEVPPRTASPETGLLELRHESASTRVRVYRPDRALRIDDAVASRRRIVAASYPLERIQESRYLLDARRLIPASLAVYHGGARAGGRPRTLSLVVEAEDGLYEVVGFTIGDELMRELRAVVTSFELLGP